MILQRSCVAQAEIRNYMLEKLSLSGAFCIYPLVLIMQLCVTAACGLLLLLL